MLPLADVENVDPQTPSERFPWQGARELDEKSSLPLHGNLRGRKTARNSRRIRRNRQSNKICYISDLVWLCWQFAANRSPVLQFPDQRENTGKFADFGLESSQAASAFAKKIQSVTNRIPYSPKQGKFEGDQGT
jgi:hypothetical protein